MKTRKTVWCITLFLVTIVAFLAQWWLGSSDSSQASVTTVGFAFATTTLFGGAFIGLAASFLFDE